LRLPKTYSCHAPPEITLKLAFLPINAWTLSPFPAIIYPVASNPGVKGILAEGK